MNLYVSFVMYLSGVRTYVASKTCKRFMGVHGYVVWYQLKTDVPLGAGGGAWLGEAYPRPPPRLDRRSPSRATAADTRLPEVFVR